MTAKNQARARDQCKNCGKRLTVDDKTRNRGTGLCWQCFVASPEARAVAVTIEGTAIKASKLTSMAAPDVLRSAADFVLQRGRWQVVHQTEGQVTLQHLAGGSCLVALFLFLLGVIPGMLYLLLAKGESRLVVRATPVGGGTEVDVSWLGRNWRELALAFLETLPEVPEEELAKIREAQAAPQAVDASPQPTKGENGEKVFEQIRELAGLRDEGLITEKEFESKKADLLSRL